jgi:hypothetical protein
LFSIFLKCAKLIEIAFFPSPEDASEITAIGAGGSRPWCPGRRFWTVRADRNSQENVWRQRLPLRVVVTRCPIRP